MSVRKMRTLYTVGLAAMATLVLSAQQTRVSGQGRNTAPEHAKAIGRLVIRNTMVVYGNGKPPFGPVDIVIEDGLISRIFPGRLAMDADAVIDGTGKYVLPGLVNTHMHWHDERAGIPQPIQYERNLYLASGVTTTRELGGDFEKSKRWQAESDAGTIVAPRMQVYWVLSNSVVTKPADLRARVQEGKRRGADGLKIFGMDRDQLEAVMDEAKQQGLKTTTHIGVEETTAKDFIDLGVNSIEHFYGVADAALDGVQHFPPDMNYSNEIHRFGQAGQLYAQANPEKLHDVIDLMVEKGVAWSPTLSIYEASRDVIRAQNQPWFKDYLHPALQAFFSPSLDMHGSYFIGWTNTQEVDWRRNYRIWMDAVLEFARKGGLVTTGDDAGFIYSMYGFGLLRELELQEEAGFQPLEVIEHATVNGAKLLGLDDRIGRVRVGYAADLIIVNGNPLENLHLLNPAGADINVNNRNVRGGGIEWTIRAGTPYHVPTLMREVRQMVEKARADRRQTTAQ